jgi:hypothetical protein
VDDMQLDSASQPRGLRLPRPFGLAHEPVVAKMGLTPVRTVVRYGRDYEARWAAKPAGMDEPVGAGAVIGA